jgi:hypothetical protein
MVANSQPIDWDLLIAAGVPLFSSSRSQEVIDWKKVATTAMNAINQQLTEREDVALRSWMIAMRDHYGTTYKLHFADPIFTDFVARVAIDGRHIKLRRIAASSLSKVA